MHSTYWAPINKLGDSEQCKDSALYNDFLKGIRHLSVSPWICFNLRLFQFWKILMTRFYIKLYWSDLFERQWFIFKVEHFREGVQKIQIEFLGNMSSLGGGGDTKSIFSKKNIERKKKSACPEKCLVLKPFFCIVSPSPQVKYRFLWNIFKETEKKVFFLSKWARGGSDPGRHVP